MGGTILWDVDTQVDFIEPGGKLYFAGAEEAKPAMARLVDAAGSAGAVHVASTDQHELSDPKVSEEPDFDSTWPPNCLLGTPGAEKIPEILLFGVATEICDDAAVRALLRRGRRIAFVEDAARGVDEERAAACIEAWRQRGVRLTTAEEAVASLC